MTGTPPRAPCARTCEESGLVKNLEGLGRMQLRSSAKRQRYRDFYQALGHLATFPESILNAVVLPFLTIQEQACRLRRGCRYLSTLLLNARSCRLSRQMWLNIQLGRNRCSQLTFLQVALNEGEPSSSWQKFVMPSIRLNHSTLQVLILGLPTEKWLETPRYLLRKEHELDRLQLFQVLQAVPMVRSLNLALGDPPPFLFPMLQSFTNLTELALRIPQPAADIAEGLALCSSLVRLSLHVFKVDNLHTLPNLQLLVCDEHDFDLATLDRFPQLTTFRNLGSIATSTGTLPAHSSLTQFKMGNGCYVHMGCLPDSLQLYECDCHGNLDPNIFNAFACACSKLQKLHMIFTFLPSNLSALSSLQSLEGRFRPYEKWTLPQALIRVVCFTRTVSSENAHVVQALPCLQKLILRRHTLDDQNCVPLKDFSKFLAMPSLTEFVSNFLRRRYCTQFVKQCRKWHWDCVAKAGLHYMELHCFKLL
jgi:hypothetical protein